MYGSDWNWCDAVTALGTLLTPFAGWSIVENWFKKRIVEKINNEEILNLESGNESDGDKLHEFWQQVQKEIPNLQDRNLPTRRFWSLPCKKGVRLAYVVLSTMARVELYIDNGNEDWNLSVYNDLKSREDTIKRRLGGNLSAMLVWFPRPNSRAKGLALEYKEAGLDDPKGWRSIVDFYKKSVPALNEAIS